MRISLKCLPVDLSIDESLERIARSMVEYWTKYIENPPSDDLDTFFSKYIVKMLSRIFLDSPLSYHRYGTLYLSTHPFLGECELGIEFSIFSDEFILGRHADIVSYFLNVGNQKND
jgi:hypothetical protein